MAPFSDRQVIKIAACDPGDPDGTRAAEVLSAYFHAEHMRAFRRTVWRNLSMVAFIWLLAAAITPFISPNEFFSGIAVVLVAGLGAVISEWLADDALAAALKRFGDQPAAR